MGKELWKIAGPPGSDSLNSCPTVIGFGDDAVATVLAGAEVLPARLRGTWLGRSRSRAVDDHALPGHAADVQVRRRDPDALALVRLFAVVARPDQDPVAGLRRANGCCDRGVRPLLAEPDADEENVRGGAGRCGSGSGCYP